MKYIIMLLFLSGCACKGVIGASYNNKTSVVDYVMKGSPAQQVDVRVGDILIDPKDIPGEVDTEVVFKLIRGKEILTKKTKRKCLDKLRRIW